MYDGTSRCAAHPYKSEYIKGKSFKGMGDAPKKRWADAPSGPSPYASVQWQQARLAWLNAHPFCAECERHKRARAATEVDHIKPHQGDRALFWDRSNWQSLCVHCHSRKTIREVNQRIAQRKRERRWAGNGEGE